MKKIFKVTLIVCSVALAVVLQSGIALAGFPRVSPPPPPPGAGAVVNAVQDAAGQAGAAVSNLTADQQRKIDDAKHELEAKARAAAAALQNAVNQRITQLNSYYNDQRRSRQDGQKRMLERSLSSKKIPQQNSGKKTMMQKSDVASGNANTQLAPRIDTVSSTAGEPGDSLLISGAGFSSATEVFFLVAPNRSEKGIVSFANNTQLMVQVPAVTGVPAYNGLVYVRREDSQMSPGAMFRFTPRTIIQKCEFEYPLNASDSFLHTDGSASNEMSVESFDHSLVFVRHENFLAGFRSNDTLFPNRRLKNGWIVEDVIFDGDNDFLAYKAQLQSSGKGGDSLRLQVHGWTIAPYIVMYSGYYHVSTLIRGPEGLSYK